MEENKITETMQQSENCSFTSGTETTVKNEPQKSWFAQHKKLVIAIMATVAIAAISLVICLNVFTYHGVRPELDLRNAEKALEDADYYVTREDDKDELEVGIEEEFYARSDDYDDNLTIIVFEDSAYAKRAYEMIKHAIESEIENTKLQISIIEYQLDNYDNDLSSYEIDELEDELKELKKELEEFEEDYVYGRSGNVIWYGTTRAAKDSKE